MSDSIQNTTPGATEQAPVAPIPAAKGHPQRKPGARTVKRVELKSGAIVEAPAKRGNINGPERVSRFSPQIPLRDGRLGAQVNLLQIDKTRDQVIAEWTERGWTPVTDHPANDKDKLVFAAPENFMEVQEKKAEATYFKLMKRVDSSKSKEDSMVSSVETKEAIGASELKDMLPSVNDEDDDDMDDDGDDDGDDVDGLE